MMINDKLANALNDQVTAEIHASLLYLQLSYALDDLGLVGMRDWMRAQHEEELEHAEAFSQHLLDRDITPQIKAIESPQVSVKTAEDAFAAALEHERKVSAMIRNLENIREEVRDLDSRPLLDQFLAEQIEEESTVSEILDRLKIAGESGSGILHIDAELGDRK
ncbi:ferritin [Corynebacterium spheniscorum]|uniref:Ferritin n=1 Tax=Corynebacterium spheniscorum TaxID=185761 RepID=A0A1I2Q9R5_9CORY|nr:ferritin [Corynebacterium spheniscorum]KAA8719625.1 ferritin [Corynebacterium spheniscorum]SFG25112.1 ferritin [Corynebacterium spheniscorum]